MSGHEMRGLLRPFLLLLLLERSSHGYDLIERLAGMGVPDVDPSHAYRVLRGLERNRLVASTWVAGGGPWAGAVLSPAGRRCGGTVPGAVAVGTAGRLRSQRET